MFKEIVLAYDGSSGSIKALQLASSLLRDCGEVHLTVVNVYDEKIETRRVDVGGDIPLSQHGYLIDGMPAPPTSIGMTGSSVSTQAIVKNSVDQIVYEAKKVLGDVNASYHILDGNPAECICSYAEEVNADLIVIGSSGKSGLKSLLIGNITEQVAKHAACHVLIAK